MSKILCLASIVLAAALAAGQATEHYVVLDGGSSLARVINTSDNSEVAAIPTGPLPNSIVFSPNKRLAFVSNLGAQYISVLDLTINAEIKRIRDIGPEQLSISSDGTKIVATHINDEGITIVDATNFSIIKSLDLNGLAGDDPNLEDLGFNNPVVSGNKVYLNTSNDIIAVDLGTFAVTQLSNSDDAFFFQGVQNLAITPDQKVLAAIRFGGLVLFDTATNANLATVPFGLAFAITTGPNPSEPSKNVAYVLNSHSGGVFLSIVDLAQGSPSFGQIIAEAPMPGVPRSTRDNLALNSDGTRVYINGPSISANPNVFIVDTGALVSNPAAAIIHQSVISVQPRSIAVAITQDQPPAGAPIVTGINRAEIKNDHDATIDISGTGFAPGPMVHIGSVDPIAAQFVSSTRLRVTVPAHAPTEIASIIVTNPNLAGPFNLRQQSGILRNALTIADDFDARNQVGVANFGDHSFSIIKASNPDGLTKELQVGLRPSDVAMSPDGSRAYIANLFPPAAVDVFNFKTNSVEAHIVLNGDPVSLPGQSKGIVLAPRFAIGTLGAFVVASRSGNLDLYTIDADPASPTFNTIVDDIPTNISTASTAPDALVMTPDGRFAFIDELENDGQNANLVVVNLATRAITLIPVGDLGALAFQLTMDISPDGKFLVLISAEDNFQVVNISDPTHPFVVTTLIGAPVPNIPHVILEFPRFVGDRLFAFDIDHNVVSIFNFKPAIGDFSQLGNFVIPGPTAIITAVGDVSPDGKLIYMPIREEDAVAVLDVDKIVNHDPSALITKIGVGLTPEFVAVRPASKDQD